MTEVNAYENSGKVGFFVSLEGMTTSMTVNTELSLRLAISV
jgi:hypothetical protein